MAPRSTKNAVSVLVWLSFALGGAFAGYFYARHEADRNAFPNFYLHSSLAAKIDATVLTDLRLGESEKAIKVMGGLLEGELISLNSYEQNVSPSERSPLVYENVAVVRSYYERFPKIGPPTYGKQGLALKQQ